MSLVTMRARVSRLQKAGSVSKAGQSYLVEFHGESKKVSSLNRAIEELGNKMREYLKAAWRKEKLPWGLIVSVGRHSAVYGDYPRFPDGGTSPLSHIRGRYKDGEPPMAAVSNAIQFAKSALRLG